jgi:hypothetical protein
MVTPYPKNPPSSTSMIAVPLNIIAAFRNGGIVGEWNPEGNVLVCGVDRVAASQRRCWTRSKERVDISLALDQRGRQEE